MDCVYIATSGDNERLKYSIRSVEKYLKYDNLIVLGYAPHWYSGPHTPISHFGQPYDNIKNALIKSTLMPHISKNFILMDENIILTKDIQSFVPAKDKGLIKDEIAKIEAYVYPDDIYIHDIKRTYSVLQSIGFNDPKDYETIFPMVLDKDKIALTEHIDALFKPLYFNKFGDENNTISEECFILSNQTTFKKFKDNNSQYLIEEKSKYEK